MFKTAGACLGTALLVIITVFYFQPRFILRHLNGEKTVYYFHPYQKAIALTIDDSPDPVTTEAILDVLEKFDVSATFFIIGERVQGNETLLRRMLQRGHEIGNHHWRDAVGLLLPHSLFEDYFYKTDSVLQRFVAPKWFRPGSGFYDQQMVDKIAAKGYKMALGSIYPHDVAVPFVAINSAYILRRAFPGGIIVLHDGAARGHRSAAVLHRVIPQLLADGYKFYTLSQLQAVSH